MIIEPNDIEGFVFEGIPVVRLGSIIYPGVKVGRKFDTGHNVIIRSGFTCGNFVSIGTNSVLDGDVIFGDYVKVATGCYIPPGVTLGSRIFLGPNVTFTNDPFPLKRRHEYKPAITKVDSNVSFGAGCVILPGVHIEKDCFIAAGSVVTKNVPSNSLVVGHGEIRPLPERLSGENNALSWVKE